MAVKKEKSVRFSSPPREAASHHLNGKTTPVFHVNTSSQRPDVAAPIFTATHVNKSENGASREKARILRRRFEQYQRDRLHAQQTPIKVAVDVSISCGPYRRVAPTACYLEGILSPTSNHSPPEIASSTGGSHNNNNNINNQLLLIAARDADEQQLRTQLRNALQVGLSEADLNVADSSGRTILSYVASNGTLDVLEMMLQIPGLDPNKSDNEGNTPLHFAAQAGQIECVSCLVSRCRGVEIDARNNLGFTPLMKAALQGRNKCAKLLLFAGANPTLRDHGRGFRADQWARFCGRYVCADVIEKHARQRLLERSTSSGSWGMEHVSSPHQVLSPVSSPPPHNGLKSKLKKVFRTSSNPSSSSSSSVAEARTGRLVTQLTSAALCASSPVLPHGGAMVPPLVKSLLKPLTVPTVQVTLANNNNDHPNQNVNEEILISKPPRKKK